LNVEETINYIAEKVAKERAVGISQAIQTLITNQKEEGNYG